MNWFRTNRTSSTGSATSVKHDASKIRALIDEATADSNDECDEHTGLLGMIREEVVCPFRVRVQGEDVECLSFKWPDRGYGLNAVCRTAKGKTRVVDIKDLEWIEPLPEGYEWIEAYFAWRDMM